MRDQAGLAGSGGAATAPSVLPSAADIAGWAARLAGDGDGLTDAERIDLIRSLEVLKCAAEGAQVAVTADFAVSQRREAARAGVRAERQGLGVASQVGLARRESPYRARQHVGVAVILTTEMPHTLAALRAGRISEYQASLMVRETACLTLPSRQHIDRVVAGDADAFEGMGIRQLIGEVAKLAYSLEPRSVVERRRQAESQRRTSLRPAPDTMAVLTALLRVKDGVAVHAVLGREADRLRDAGDERSRSQLMADILVQRVLAPSSGDAEATTGASITVNLVVTDGVLLGDDPGSGWVEGYGPVPGDLIREWIADRLDIEARGEVTTWLRRLYVKPSTGQLVAMDSQARRFTGGLAEFLRLRDQSCRTPWCDAPIRHLDHVVAHADGGPTDATNGQGLCEACNYAKQAQGWQARPRPGPRHGVETVTPTGHTYVSMLRPACGRRITMDLVLAS